MPSLANIYCHGVPSGLTLTGELYPDGSDTAAGTGLTVTEQTNRKATYVLNAGVSGLHLIKLKSGSNVVWDGWTPANLANTGDFEACATRREALNLDAKVSDVPAAVRDVDNTTPAEGSLGAVVNAISSIFNGMTSLANWLRRGFRKDAGTANMGTALSEINAGGGAFAAGDALEGIRDAVDGVSGGGSTPEEIAEAVDTKLSDTHGDGAWDGAIDTDALAEAIAEELGANLIVNDFTNNAMQKLRVGLRGTLIRVRGPVTQDEDDRPELTLVIGDDYLNDDTRAIEFDVQDVPDLTDAEIVLRLRPVPSGTVVEIEGTATVPTGDTKTIRFQPTAAETALLTRTDTPPSDKGVFDVKIVDADGHVITPLELRGVLHCVPPLG